MYRQDIQQHIQALQALIDQWDTRAFEAACNALVNLKGKWIVTGVGKSGCMGQHLASTLAATGTPAIFLHPTEALHGDLGVANTEDGWIFLSQSGSTKELCHLQGYIPSSHTLAITGQPHSPLARKASIHLPLPLCEEICALGLAPTTSSAVMLTLSNVLAVSVMRRKKPTRREYQKRHPAGLLGLQALSVRDKMRSPAPCVLPTDHMDHVLMEMTAKSSGCVCVWDKRHHLLGFISDGDLRRAMNPNLLQQKASEIMTRNVHYAHQDMSVKEAKNLMHEMRIMALPVVDAERIVLGWISLHDLRDVHE